MHPTLVFNREDPDAVARAQAAFDDMLVATFDLGSTLPGEHGVGLLKRPFLDRQLGATSTALHHTLKAALDIRSAFSTGASCCDAARSQGLPAWHSDVRRGFTASLCGGLCSRGGVQSHRQHGVLLLEGESRAVRKMHGCGSLGSTSRAIASRQGHDHSS
ncbi:FAD-linked oxidase C-terminal domain-containing protein [Melittangium boletus]|uniref:FAD-linked oxidase C-terminal domain-containing protein n=1 Tax=Melittangium boletus TaxID=83453 RepID=UPI003DA1CE49